MGTSCSFHEVLVVFRARFIEWRTVSAEGDNTDPAIVSRSSLPTLEVARRTQDGTRSRVRFWLPGGSGFHPGRFDRGQASFVRTPGGSMVDRGGSAFGRWGRIVLAVVALAFG